MCWRNLVELINLKLRLDNYIHSIKLSIMWKYGSVLDSVPDSMFPSMCFQVYEGQSLWEKDRTAVWRLTLRHRERCLSCLCHYSYSCYSRHTHRHTHTRWCRVTSCHCSLHCVKGKSSVPDLHKHTHTHLGYSLLTAIFSWRIGKRRGY